MTVQPGGFTGWHSHPGPAIVVVQEGTFTYYDGEDPTCTPLEYGPGEAFVDLGQGHVHSARNEGSEVVQVYVMYFDVPSSVANPFVPADDPGFCDF
ncbi:MAG TPA: cupin domain-containing protein [Actinomycetota bacterium]|nr:cupin domain-containing protein [Actinomycetota bacterium]